MEITRTLELLKACAKEKDLRRGIRVHADILKSGLLEKSCYVANTVISMYANCGAFEKAQQVLDELPARNVVSWNTLITGFVQHGQFEEALDCFHRMQQEGLSPNAVTFTCILKACGNAGAVDKGEQIHGDVVRRDLLRRNVVLGTALVDMYSKCGALAKAREVFDKLPFRNVVSWSALIAGYAQQGQGKEALDCFARMKCEGISPNAFTFACVLKACGSIGAADKGKQTHDEICRRGLLGKNIVLDTALVDMYARCGALANAQGLLDELPVRDVVTWGALIAGYAQHGHGEEALNCFNRMRSEGLSPDVVTLTCVLKACGSIGAIDKGQQIHNEIARQGLLGKDFVLGTALVDMYAKCGALSKAQQVLNELPARNVVAWNVLFAGYAQQGQGQEALNCFERMQCEGISPDTVTFTCILKACTSIGAVDKVEEIHEEIVRLGLLGKDMVLGTTLVDMYIKCGALAKARQVLDEFPVRDVVFWGALIAGYALEGHAEEALNCFTQMQQEGLSPNAVILACVLNACRHSGLLHDGQMYFKTISSKYGITPDIEHYTCMVDLFGRAGDFDKALAVIEKMPSSDYLPVWAALLGACRKWGNVSLGRFAFYRRIEIERNDAAAYVCMTNIYAAAGMQEEAEKIEAMRVEIKAWRK